MNLKIFKRNEGIALFISILIALLGLLVIATIFSIILIETKTSGSIKRYTTALEAAKGASEDVLHDIKALLSHSTLIGAWKIESTNKVENEYHTSPPQSAEAIKTNYDWKKDYGDFVSYGMITNTHVINLGVDKKRYYYSVEILSINKKKPQEKAWLSIIYQVDKT